MVSESTCMKEHHQLNIESEKRTTAHYKCNVCRASETRCSDGAHNIPTHDGYENIKCVCVCAHILQVKSESESNRDSACVCVFVCSC